MATSAQVPLEAAPIGASADHETEFVDGKVIERSMPNQEHAAILYAIITALVLADKQKIIRGRPELRVQTGEGRFRVADLALYVGEAPPDAVPSEPPTTVVEILSPDDPMEGVMVKLGEYESWGVSGVWLVVPRQRAIYRMVDGALRVADSIDVGQTGIVVSSDAVFAGR